MENDWIEDLSVTIIEKEVCKYRNLKPHIPKNDKGISWDGYITVFDGRGRGTNNFEYNINVQVKGRKVEKIRQGKNKFPIEKAHLLNYQKQQGGTLLLVVDIVDEDNYQIYYANLLPVDLKQILENNHSKAKEPKISIQLRPVKEATQSSLRNVCMNFAINSKRQAGAVIKDMKDLKNISKIDFKVVSDKDKIFDYMLNNDVYSYATLDDDLNTIVALPKEDIVLITSKIEESVKIKDKEYYSSYYRSIQKEGETYKIGKSITIDFNKRKIIFKFEGTFKEIIKDLQFYVDLLKNKQMSLNGGILTLSEFINKEKEKTIEEIINDSEKKICDYKIIVDIFSKLNISFDDDVNKLTQQDFNNIQLLKNLFYDGIIPENLKITNQGVNTLTIGKYTIAIWCQKENNVNWKCYNYFSDLKENVKISTVPIGEEPDEKMRMSPYFVISAKDVAAFSNFNAEIVLQSLDIIGNWKKQSGLITESLLELIEFYDENNDRKEVLQLARDINARLLEKEDSVTNKINKFQILRRYRKLTESEKEELIQIRKNLEEDDVYVQNQCGIAILLENKSDYEYYFKRLNEEEKEKFEKYPIVKLIEYDK